MENAYVHFANGFEEIEALTIIDVLRRADIPVKMVSVTGKREVRGAHDIIILADVLFEEVDYNQNSIVILPGGMPGSKNLMEHAGLKKVIEEQYQNNKPLAAICAAPMVFGQMGLLKGKNAACYPGFEDYLEGATLKSDLAVKSDQILTSRGPGTALNFALEIVKWLKGKEKASELAGAMLVQTWN